MTIIDRYLFLLSVKIFLVCFISFSGLFVVIHLFTNLDEMMAIKNAMGWKAVGWEFYAPRVAEIFDKTSAVWMLMAAVFTISLLQRKRELTAVEAAGIPRARILRPLFVFALIIIALGAVNRESLLPLVRDHLVRSAQNWLKQDNLPMGTYHDLSTGVRVRGSEVSIQQNRITKVEVQLPALTEGSISHIQAEVGVYSPDSESQAAGIKLIGITFPPKTSHLTTQDLNGIRVHWPGDSPWLKADECYVVCQFDAYQAAYGLSLQNYQSVPEMMQELRKPRAWYGNRAQVNVHARMVRPLLDFSLLLIGLPLVLSRNEKNVFLASGLCFVLVGVFVLTVLISHALGEYSIVQPAAMAAWIPLIVFFPMAVVSANTINR
jgi:lipopolysaccharide export system permease protein